MINNYTKLSSSTSTWLRNGKGVARGIPPGTRSKAKDLWLTSLLLIVCLMFNVSSIFAQTAPSYSFSAAAGSYSSISGTGTSVAIVGDDPAVNITGLSPAFVVNGVSYTNARMSANGWLMLYTTTAPTATGLYGTALSVASTNAAVIFAPCNADMHQSTTATTAGYRQTIGGVHIFEWVNVSRYALGGGAEQLNFQVRLDTNNGDVSFSYGNFVLNSAFTASPQVGWKTAGTVASNWSTDINNLRIDVNGSPNTCNWLNAVTGNANNSTMYLNTTNGGVKPNSGLTYTWSRVAPQAPVRTFTAATGIAASTATVNWTAPAGATSYNVQYRIPGSCTWTNWSGNPVATNTVTLTGLTPVTSYQVRVQALNGANQSIYSHIPNAAGTGDGYNASGSFTTLPNVCVGTPAASNIIGTTTLCANTGTTLALSNTYTASGISYQWASSATAGGPYTNLGTAATQATGNLTQTTYYICTISCSGGSSFTTAEQQVLVNQLPLVTVSSSASFYCTPGGTAVSLTAGGALTYTWSPAAGLSGTTGQIVTATPTVTTAYTVTGTDGNTCQNSATTTVNVFGIPQGVSATATPATICTGGTTTLNAFASIPSAVNSYAFAASTGAALDPMVGATTVLTTGNDDTVSASLTLPFSFNFNGVDYTTYTISPDGWIKFGAAGSNDFSNQVTEATNLPKLYPYWDDLATGTDGNVKVLTIGSAPNRIFVAQWFITSPRATGGPANSTFQAWMYEGSNKVEFRYGTMGAAGSASVGLTGSATQFQSITLATNTISTSVANDSNAIAPTAGTSYMFTPPTATFSWSPALSVVNPNSQSTSTTALNATQTFTVIASNNVCSAAPASATVTITPLTCTAATYTSPNCAGSNFTVTANIAGGGAPYSYVWSDGVGGVYPNAATITANLPAGTYNFTCNVVDSCGASCSSNVTVVVYTIPTVSVTPGSALYCNPGTAVSLTASGAATYMWSPAAGLSATTGSVVGASPSSATTYSVIGTSINGCVASVAATANISVSTAPSAVTVTPSVDAGVITNNTICAGNTLKLTASGGAVSAINTILAENFDTDAPNWVITNGGASPAVSNWAYQSVPFSYSTSYTGFSTVNGGKFAITNADAGGSGSTTNTILTSPSFSTVGFTTADLSFEQVYRVWSSGDATVKVEISTDGGTNWATLQDYIGNAQGSTTSTAPATISLASFLNQSNLKIRFNYVSTWGFEWILDDIKVSGNYPVNVSQNWTAVPATPLYTDAAATVPYVANTPATIVYAKPTASTTFYSSYSNGPCSAEGSATVNVNELPSFSVNPITICGGTTGTLTAISGGSNSYSWTPVGGGATLTGASVNVSPLATTTYNVTATSNTTIPACSNTIQVTVTVNDPGTIVSGTTTRTVSPGQVTTFEVVTSGGPLTYQWQVNDNVNGWQNIAAANPDYTGENTAILNVTNITLSFDTFQYRCLVTGQAPCATLTPIEGVLNVTNTGFSQQPASVNLCGQTATTFSIVTTGDEPYNVQWQISTDNGNNFTDIVDGFDVGTGLTFAGANDFSPKTLSVSGITTANNGYQFKCQLDFFLDSSVATLTVNTPVSVVSNFAATPIVRCGTPSSPATNLSITTSGSVAGVVWKYATSAAGPWNTLAAGTPVGASYSGATTNTLSVTTTAATPTGNYFYKAFVTGAGSGPNKCADQESNVATITVGNPIITVTASAPVYCAPGTPVTLTAAGSNINSYSWSTSQTGTAINVTPSASTTYTVTGTDSNGCTGTAQTTINVGGSFTLAATPASATSICQGSSLTLGATPTQAGGATYLVNAIPYQFTPSSGTFTPLVGGTSSSLAATTDFGISTTITPGFSFVYGGTTYTSFRVSADGVLIFGGSGAATGANNLATTTATQRPGLALLWDDLQCTSGVTYQISGVAPNRVLTVEWLNMEWNWSANAAVVSFQAKLYETSNAIEYIYRQEGTAVNNGSSGATIGLMGVASSNFISLQDTSANPAISTSTSANGLSTRPATGQVYRFTPVTPVTYTYAWTSSPAGFTSTSAAPSVAPTAASTTYSVEATSNQGCKAQATTGAVTVIPTPVVTATNNGQPSAARCGTGKVTLTATASAGNVLNWYTAATGGSPVFTGTAFQTPDLTTSTPYYVEAATPVPASPVMTYCASTSTSTSYFINNFSTTGGLTNISNLATGQSPSGYGNYTAMKASQSAGSSVSFTVVPASGTYGIGLWIDWNNDGDFSDANEQIYNSAAYVSNATANINVPASVSFGTYRMRVVVDFLNTTPPPCGTTSTSAETEDYTFEVAGCRSASRTQVNAVINPAPGLALTSTTGTICLGGSTNTVNITPATIGNYTSYSWSPSGSVTGSAAAGYVFSPSVSTVYTLSATEAGGCFNSTTYSVTVNPLPLTPTLTASTPICEGSALNLTATSGSPTILAQNFESGLGAWTTTNTSSGGSNPAGAAWTIQTNPFSYSSTPYSSSATAGTKFIWSNADTAGSGVTVNTTLVSPAFNTGGYSAASLGFRMYYRNLTTGTAEVFVETSTNGTTWTTAQSYSATQGTGTGFASFTIPLTAGNAVNYVRFRYSTGWGWYVGIDDIAITGTPIALSYAWTGPNGFTSSTQNPTIAGATPAASGTYNLEVTNSFGCKVNATVSALVHPTPTAVAPANQLYYNGLATAAIPLSGTPSGVTFDISGGAAIGLANATGITTIPSFIPATGSATVTITPKANNCTGASVSYNIVVSAVNTNPIANQSYCEGATTSAIPLTASPASLLTDVGVTFNITGGASVGLADVTGVSAIPSFVPTPGSATIFVYPVYGGVIGGFATATITVNPLPTATISGSTAVCQNDTAPLVTFTGATGTAPYTFTYRFNGGGYQTIVSSGNTATIAQPTGTAGTFTYTLVSVQDSSSTTCSNAQSGTVTIIVHPTPTVNAVANQNYYSGFPTAAIPLTGTPSGVTFNISGGAASGLADVNGVTAIPSFIPTATPSTVTITPYANGCYGVPRTYQIAFNPVVVNITSNVCGSINNGLNNQINCSQASVFGYTVTGYQFEITNTDTGVVSIVQSSQHHFKLTDADNYAYGTTFTIRVAAILNGNVQGYYGNTCSLTTASVATTKVVTAQCGATLLFVNSTINANTVSSTNLYRFRVSLASAPTTYYYIERTVPNFKLTDVVGLPILFNTEYRVDVQIRVKLAGFEAWSQYGQRCSVFTPAAPETSLVASQCEDYLVPSNTSPINAIAFPGATAYRFRLTSYDEFGDINYQQTVTNATASFTLSQFSGLTPGATYTVAVALELFGTFTDYAKDCSIITPAASKQVTAEPFKATAYPNPFAANFMIDVKTTSTSVIAIKVYDMVGRLVEQKSVTVADLGTSPIGNNYPSGVYNVVVTQDETVQTVRVVKR